jgi:nucleoside-diphosphate-sugar epimerase
MGNSEKRRLAIFGCGYVGGELARQAMARGFEVTALTRNATTGDALRNAGIHMVAADLATDDWHSEMTGPFDHVLNAVSSGGAGLAGYERSYVGGMQSIQRWAQATGPHGTFVYTSSTSVYPQDGGMRVPETCSTEGAGERAQILLKAEKLAETMAFQRVFILRLAGIYGPGRHHVLDQVRTGEISGRGDHRLNLVHRDDIVSAIWAAFSASAEIEGGIFNVADDGAPTKVDLADYLAGELGLPPPRFTGIPVGARRAMTPDRVIENTRLKRVLGWSPQYPTFREGYKKMLAPGSE